ncbi:hypothetical protein KUTeg_021579 [Tegillarca granosa]|uniref:Uncharacterized protein n=1 Tax=Tegillarca granosa TaxID=220873 RepID=A0ABQ9E985_TEGGR|nr:hypothetical protein KUTeg_021579 [Tegillarca granosa]
MKDCQIKEVRFKNSNTKSNSKKETANDRKADQKQDNPSGCTTENKSEINEPKSRVYKRISEECRPKLTPTVKPSGPGGDPLKELGKARFNLEFDNFKLSEDLIVAEIADDGLLGVDVLQNHSLGPADILLSKGIIRLGGNEINCMQIGIQNKTRKVTVADHIDIPGYSEAVIDVFVEDGDNELDVNEIMVIEPVANLSERYSIIMGRVVVDTRNNATVKVRVMNLYPNMVSINQDAVIGQAETCTILNELSRKNMKKRMEIFNASNKYVQRGEHFEHEFKPSKEETEQEISNQNQNNLKTNESKCESLSTRSVVTRSKKNTDIKKHSSHTNPSTDIPVDSNFKNLHYNKRKDPDLEQIQYLISMRPVKYPLVGRRDRANECGSCHNYQGEKRDVQSHFYNNNVKPEDIPYRCGLCNFKCTTEKELKQNMWNGTKTIKCSQKGGNKMDWSIQRWIS